MDITCLVCNEPWDSMGIEGGDMEKWESVLFRKGAGCPCCEGVSNGFEPTKLSDFDNGDEDPMVRIDAYHNRKYKKIEWIKPEDKILYTCSGCGVEAKKDILENEYYFEFPVNAISNQWYHRKEYNDQKAKEEPICFDQNGDDLLCPYCVHYCDDCGEQITDRIDFGDTYDNGQSFFDQDSQRSYCIDCFEKIAQF